MGGGRADTAAHWLADDPDADDRRTVSRLLAADDVAGLARLFGEPLCFGTAGIRGPMQPGPSGINRVTVVRAAAGLAEFLGKRCGASGTAPRVVVAFDGRHRSEAFAADSAEVLAGAGCRVWLMDRAVPTPLLAFAVRRLRTDAGVMITASHNPPGDNGLKVYLGGPDGSPDDGAQLVGPDDTAIEAAIGRVPSARKAPRSRPEPLAAESLLAPYLTAVAELPGLGPRGVRLAYTPLHGVAGDVTVRALTAAGFAAPAVVREQADPDPDFPTVPFPNPEEAGALDRLLALVAATGADLGIASDPDGDRCAAVVGRRVLTGDELGCLLADAVLRRNPGPVATTLVSATLLPVMADRAGVRCATTATGFKWLMRADPGLVFAYEEALGYAVAPDLVRDKDGISAAVVLAGLAAELAARGRTLLDRLDELAAACGLHVTEAVTVRLPPEAGDPMARLRADPPTELAGHRVVAVHDHRVRRPDGASDGPSIDAVTLVLDGSTRVIVRPSGTEPKLKAYLEVVRPAAGGAALTASRAEANRVIAGLAAAVRELFDGRSSTLPGRVSRAPTEPGTSDAW